jgi:hypothetical protein
VECLRFEAHRARTARPEQRRALDARTAVATQVQIGRATLHFVAHEGIHDHSAAIDAADRPIGVQTHRQSGRAGQL